MTDHPIRRVRKGVSRKSSPRSKKGDKSGSTKGSASRTTAKSSGTKIGTRIGTKRSDLRYRAEDGSEWASPFEWKVFNELGHSGSVGSIRRAGPTDTLAYNTPVKLGRCTECGSHCVIQSRHYTPDLYLVPRSKAESEGYFLETKGYFPGPKRALFRAAVKANPQVDIRLVASNDHWVTKGKTRLSDWAKRFGIRFHKWDGALPQEWL